MFRKEINVLTGEETTIHLSESEIEELIQSENNRIESLTYIDKRISEYPEIGEQLDMLWHAIDQDSLNKNSNFYLSLKAVKDKYPKG